MKTILITGGSLINKGAQAMLYVTVCEMKKHFPDKIIQVMMDKNGIPIQTDLGNFRFEIVDPRELQINDPFCFSLWKRIRMRCNLVKQIHRIKLWKNIDCVIDISGFAVGKKWGMQKSCRVARKAAIAKKFGAGCIFLPQSFGPFDFTGMSERQLRKGHRFLKKWLGCADVIYAREESGKQMLEETYHLKNVKLAQDIVLQNKNYDLNLIYKNIPEIRNVEVANKSVALIPNIHVLSGKVNDAYAIWNYVIQKLRNQGYNVYLVMHDASDLKVIQKLKDCHEQDAGVVLLDNDFSCIEFNELVRKFEFLVASRFHSIVHAYKNGVPCIALGWADKYRELLDSVDQGQYLIDMRCKVEEKRLDACIDDMMECRMENRERIRINVERIQQKNVFDDIKG